MRSCQLIRSLAFVTLCLVAQPAGAVILYMKGQEQPVRGYLVRQNEQVVVLRELAADGQTRQRTVSRSQIEDAIITVSEERLSSLQPGNPDAYREYAEELAEKRKDPDAQVTAIRLFLIAAYLAPDALGRSSLLGAVPLARNETEQRRFRAMAYLLDSGHAEDLLRITPAVKPRSTDLEPRQLKYSLRAFRLLRQGKKAEALKQAKRIHLHEHLSELTDAITYEEFLEACEPVCPHCKRGRVPCPECRGEKFILGGGFRRIPCPTCGARGDVTCPYCGGDYQNNPLPASLLKRIIQLELDWLPGDDEGGAGRTPPATRSNWSQTMARGTPPTVRPLTLELLTEFDPRLCHYRGGRWTK